MDDAPRPASATFIEGDLPRHVWRLSGFMILGFLTMTAAHLVEAVYLGFIGSHALAAVTFAFPVIMALGAATRGIGMGAGAVLARAMGGGDRERAAFLVTHGLTLVLAFNIACAVLLVAFARPLFSLLGADGEVLDLVVAYIDIWSLGFPLFGLSMVGTGLMRSIGDPVFPGYVMTVGSILQAAIGPFLIFGVAGLPALGVEGAAWSFVIARSLSFLLAVYWFCCKERMIRVPGWLRPGPAEKPPALGFLAASRSILHVGIPALAANLIEPLAAAIVTRLLATFGTSVVAGFGAAARIDAVAFMVVIGISSSATPLVGQNWAAGRFDRVDAALALCYRYCLAWGVVAAVILWAGGRWFASLVNSESEVVAAAVSYLYIVPITIGFAGMVNVANGAFNALSRPLPPLLLSLLRIGAFYVPLALLASRWFGYAGVFAALACTNVVMGLWGRAWNRRLIRRERNRLVD